MRVSSIGSRAPVGGAAAALLRWAAGAGTVSFLGA